MILRCLGRDRSCLTYLQTTHEKYGICFRHHESSPTQTRSNSSIDVVHLSNKNSAKNRSPPTNRSAQSAPCLFKDSAVKGDIKILRKRLSWTRTLLEESVTICYLTNWGQKLSRMLQPSWRNLGRYERTPVRLRGLYIIGCST